MTNRLLFAFRDRIGVFCINKKLLCFAAMFCWLGMSLFSTSVGVAAPTVTTTAPTPVAVNAAPPVIGSETAILMVAGTKQILYEKDSHKIMYPASTTKMMTLIVALENGNLDDVIEASEKASKTEGSSLWLEHGEKLTLRDLLYGVMLVSGNDATVAVAEHIAGSVDAYAKLMTKKAHEIGAVHTSFTNSSGLPDPNHYSTAHDLAMIAAYGYKNPLFEEFVSTKSKIIPWAMNDFGRELFNENRMLWLYEGGNGVKTGYTDAAGRCLVSGAKREGVQLVAVVLDSEFMWNDSIALLDYSFKQIKAVKLYNAESVVKNVLVDSGVKSTVDIAVKEDVVIPMVEEDKQNFVTVVDIPERINAGFAKGDKLGTLRVMYHDKEVAATDLIATHSVEKKSFFQAVYKSLTNIVNLFVTKFF